MEKSPVANLDTVKQHNMVQLFRIIVEYGLVSRTQLAELSNMAAGTVTKLARLLIEQGLVHEVAQQESERGRKAVLLAPKTDDIQILAARADREHLYVGLCDLSGHLLHRISEPLKASSQKDFTDQLISVLREFRQQHHEIIRRIIGIGVTMPGLVDAESGIVSFMPHVPVENMPLRDIIQTALDLPCFINSFAPAMALAEKQIGASFNVDSSAFVEIHNGVGCGLILNGELFSGGGVGEIGHMQVEPLGQRCICGNYGCLETVVSDHAMVAHYHALQLADGVEPEELSIQKIMQRLESRDALALTVVREAAVRIGTALAVMVNLIRPQAFILAGEITKAWSTIEPVIEQQLKNKSLHMAGLEPVRLLRSDLYDSPWYSGYALVRQGLLNGSLFSALFDAA